MTVYAYVGCRTTQKRNARGKGIEIFTIDEITGEWTKCGGFPITPNPSYLCFDKAHEHLYTVHGDYSEATAFKVDKSDGGLFKLNTVSTGGENPVFITPDKTDRWLIAANLQTGSVVSFRKDADGSLSDMVGQAFISGIGPGEISHPHQTVFDRGENFLIVPAQGRKAGLSKTTVFEFDPADGSFREKTTLKTRDRAEARHMAFHPNGGYCYLVNEKDNTVCFHHYDPASGTLTPKQILPVLPDTYTGNGQASGIVITGDGMNLYVSNRIHDSIAHFAIDPATGMISASEWISSYGRTPRFITLGPDGRTLYAANEDSDTIVRYEIKENGALEKRGDAVNTGSPVCIIFAEF
ncbi:lactonase family protein [Cloacibacillus evryensis]|uniref:lactonase family protein n=1 Tax=Cloacibacillus evryensis TaxID=508460 RepID=UPI0004BABC34|nr:lactonase family protein [Cloacibacillus evryensis]